MERRPPLALRESGEGLRILPHNISNKTQKDVAHAEHAPHLFGFYQVLLDTWVHRLYLEDLIDEVGLSPNLALLRLLVIPDQEVSESAQAILTSSNNLAEFRMRLDLVEAILI